MCIESHVDLCVTWRMLSSGMLCHVALVRTDISEELSASFIRVTRIGELGTTLAVTSNQYVGSYRATRRNISEDDILHSDHCENLKSYTLNVPVCVDQGSGSSIHFQPWPEALLGTWHPYRSRRQQSHHESWSRQRQYHRCEVCVFNFYLWFLNTVSENVQDCSLRSL
jgi:hypothetical protein